MDDVFLIPAASQQQGKRCLLGPGAAGEPHGNTVPMPRLGTPGRSIPDQEKSKFSGPQGICGTSVVFYLGGGHLFCGESSGCFSVRFTSGYISTDIERINGHEPY